jgi:hypothetical protein
MNNSTLFWIALAAFSLQDLFKKQTTPTKKQQQFLETGETTQAFIAGQKQIYFESQAQALDYAFDDVGRKFEIVFPDYIWAEHISYGKYKKYTFDLLTKNGNMSRKMLVIMIYRLESGTYELTYYVA